MKASHKGIYQQELEAQGVRYDKTGRVNCPNGLDLVIGRRPGAGWCRNCERPVMFVRASRNRKAHWQHVGDGLAQYRSW